MESEIRRLEQLARRLEPNARSRTSLLKKIAAYAEDFLEQLPESPAFIEQPGDGRSLYDSPIGEYGLEVEDALEILRGSVDTVGINPASPRMLGYVPGGGLFHSALGDFLAAITNRYSGHFFASPGAVRMENMLIRWIADIAGYPQTAAGNLTSGGSLANLNAIVVARDNYRIEAQNIEKSVVYLTEHTHHSVDKSLHVAGVSKCIIRRVSVDHRFRMDEQALEELIIVDKAAGLNPWLVIASAGTTNAGAVDPLKEIGEIARNNGLWFHIDGAYGAFFALCDEGQAILKGMDQSDSIIMDPHKALFLPYGTGAVILRNGQQLYASYNWKADYAQDVPDDLEEWSPSELSPELTRHFRGLRLWLPLKMVGVASFRAALSEKILLARYFHHKLKEMDGFEVGPEPDLSIASYRAIPDRGDIDDYNRRLVEELRADGRVLISSTRLGGNYVLRLAVVSFRTHLDEIEETIEILRSTAARLRGR